MQTDDLASQIKNVLTKEGVTLSELAEKLSADEIEVSSCLYKELGKEFFQDNQYRWYPRAKYVTSVKSRTYSQGKLARLSAYYLDAIRQTEDTQYSCFAYNKYGLPGYTEISSLPGADALSLFAGELRDLYTRAKRSRSRKEVYFGYPVYVKKIQNKKGWEGYIVEPVIVYAVNFETDEPSVEFENPIVNMSILKSVAGLDTPEELAQEVVMLEDELGILQDAVPSPADIVQRLYALRKSWNWREPVQPFELSSGRSIAETTEEGLYNKAIFFMAERSMFTKGLESELSKLANPGVETQNNALTYLLKESASDEDVEEFDKPLLEILPLNNEQRHAIKKALTSRLSVVTGPPGTGKSQLITNLIVNAIWQGQSVLFASKNNKAVDVVDVRVNYASNYEVMVRTGSGKYQARTAEYLLNLLNTTLSPIDREDYEYHLGQYRQISEKLSCLQKEIDTLRILRNTVDELDKQYVELLTGEGEEYVGKLRNLDVELLELAIVHVREEVSRLSPTGIIPSIKILFARKKYENSALESINRLAEIVNLPSLDVYSSGCEENIVSVGQDLVHGTRLLKEYDVTKEALRRHRSFEAMAQDEIILQKSITNASNQLWRLHTKLSADRLTDQARGTISKYKAILQMIKRDVDIYKDLGRDSYSVYKKISEDAVRYLPAWAVTALSAKGKIPFQSGLFDLVIFDEASQCDIASALPLLYRAKRAVIIGDPKQLSHVSALGYRQDQSLLQKHHLLEDMPEWGLTVNSLYDLAQSKVKTEDFVSLVDHHRSHGDIISFSNEHFYGGNLRVATKYDSLVTLDGSSGVRWVDTGRTNVTRPVAGSAVNVEEAEKVVAFIKDLLEYKGYKGTVGVVSPFRAQANLILEKVEQLVDGAILEKANFISNTVHLFQGDERDIIVFSACLSEEAHNGAVHFVSQSANLFNVALTRARAQFIVVGDRSYALKGKVPLYQKFAAYVESVKQKDEALTDVATGDPEIYLRLAHTATYSEWEVKLYKALLQEGIKTIPQYSIDAYRLDLALIDGDRRLDIEIDGERYHREWTGELTRRDQLRNQRMFELGWDVKRFWVYQVRDDIEGCINDIRGWLNNG